MIYQFASCELDTQVRELKVGGTPVHLEPQVFDVLHYLLERRDDVVSRDELIAAVWAGRIVSDTTISARIWAARHAVGDTGEAQAVIRTLPRRGFRFVAPVTVAAPGSGEASPGRARRWRWAAAAAPVFLLLAVTGGWWMAASDADSFTLGDKPSVAVMPFNTFSSAEEQRFLAEGMAEDLRTELARNSDLTVMARVAASDPGERDLSAHDLASEWGVRYVVAGSVRRSGEGLRISVQLIDAGSGNHLWADRFDITASTVYRMQDEIVAEIVGTLLSEVRETRKAAALRRPPDNLDVYELSLRGLARKHRLNPEDSRLAHEDLLRAIELDPQYAPAWLYLGWVEAIEFALQWSDADLGEAQRKIERALELDPTLASAYQALSLVRSFSGDFEGALRAAKRSVELGPGDADNLVFLGRALATAGEFDKAVAQARHAMALNPSRPSYYAYYLARALWGRRDLPESKALIDECLTKAPAFSPCRIFRIAIQSESGNADEAAKAVAELLEQSPSFSVHDAVQSSGFAGDPASDERLASHLLEAGLPAGDRRVETR